MTPAGIEPATFRFVAQHLNYCATAVLGKDSESSNSKLITDSHLNSRVSEMAVHYFNVPRPAGTHFGMPFFPSVYENRQLRDIQKCNVM